MAGTEIFTVVLANIKADRELEELPALVSWEFWEAGKYPATPTHIGECDVRYNDLGHRAIYGFDADGNVFCYMD